jgi:hypothetical protein
LGCLFIPFIGRNEEKVNGIPHLGVGEKAPVLKINLSPEPPWCIKGEGGLVSVLVSLIMGERNRGANPPDPKFFGDPLGYKDLLAP